MARINLYGICLAFFLVPSITYAVDTVKVYQGSTTYQVLGTVKGTKGVTGVPTPYTTSPGPYRVYQGAKHGVEIPAYETRASFGARFAWKHPKVVKAAKALIKGSRFTGWGIVAGVGLDLLIDELGWFIDNEGNLVRYLQGSGEYLPVSDLLYEGSTNKHYDSFVSIANDPNFTVCHELGYCQPIKLGVTTDGHGVEQDYGAWKKSNNENGTRGSWITTLKCPLGTVFRLPLGCFDLNSQTTEPVTSDIIDSADFSSYNPTVEEINAFSQYLQQPDFVEITEQPKPFKLPTETVTSGDTVTTTETTVTPQITASPDGEVFLSLEETTVTSDYSNGELVDQQTTTSETDYSGTPSTTEPPIDCDLVPTLCDTQNKIIEQNQELADFITSEEGIETPDLPAIKEFDTSDDEYLVDLGSSSCPPPRVLNISLGEFVFTYDLFCDFFSKIKPLLLAASAIIAAYIILGVSRNA